MGQAGLFFVAGVGIVPDVGFHFEGDQRVAVVDGQAEAVAVVEACEAYARDVVDVRPFPAAVGGVKEFFHLLEAGGPPAAAQLDLDGVVLRVHDIFAVGVVVFGHDLPFRLFWVGQVEVAPLVAFRVIAGVGFGLGPAVVGAEILRVLRAQVGIGPERTGGEAQVHRAGGLEREGFEGGDLTVFHPVLVACEDLVIVHGGLFKALCAHLLPDGVFARAQDFPCAAHVGPIGKEEARLQRVPFPERRGQHLPPEVGHMLRNGVRRHGVQHGVLLEDLNVRFFRAHARRHRRDGRHKDNLAGFHSFRFFLTGAALTAPSRPCVGTKLAIILGSCKPCVMPLRCGLRHARPVFPIRVTRFRRFLRNANHFRDSRYTFSAIIA